MASPYYNLLQIISHLSTDDQATERRISAALRQAGILIRHLPIILKLAVNSGMLRRTRNRYFLTHPCYLERVGSADDDAADNFIEGLLEKLRRDICKIVHRFSEEFQNNRDNILEFFRILGFNPNSMSCFLDELVEEGYLTRNGSRFKVTRRCNDIIHCNEERTPCDAAADEFLEKKRRKLHREICETVRYFQRTNSAKQNFILSIFHNQHYGRAYIENVLNQLVDDGLLARSGPYLIGTNLCEEILGEPGEECAGGDEEEEEDDEDIEEEVEEPCIDDEDEEEDDENDRTLVDEEEEDENDRTLVDEDEEDDENNRTLGNEDQEEEENAQNLANEEDDEDEEMNEMVMQCARRTLLLRNICFAVRHFEDRQQATEENIVNFFSTINFDRPHIQRLLGSLVREGFLTRNGCFYASTNRCRGILEGRNGSGQGEAGGSGEVAGSNRGPMEAATSANNGGAGEPAPRVGAQKKRCMDPDEVSSRPSKKGRYT